ncbi:hypothetical protein C3B78_05065 [Arthrobacter sp. PGP41]|nr:hypothetical protein C3B78_05065 [Arthrobacter sp. PGP41]
MHVATSLLSGERGIENRPASTMIRIIESDARLAQPCMREVRKKIPQGSRKHCPVTAVTLAGLIAAVTARLVLRRRGRAGGSAGKPAG